MKLFAPDNAHWYSRDGVPSHTVTAKAGHERKTTLADARKLGLLPSVTNYLAVIAKPELTSWLREQAVLAALTLPRINGESDDDFAKRVAKDSDSARDNAADFGTAFHHAAERIANGQDPDADSIATPFIPALRDWFKANILGVRWTEQTLVNTSTGFAGTADLLAEHQEHGLTLFDYKTQKIKDGEKPRAYSSWCYQLAAYRRALGLKVNCVNIIINSTKPADVVEHKWSEEELEQGWKAFQAATTIWKIEKKYEPAADANH